VFEQYQAILEMIDILGEDTIDESNELNSDDCDISASQQVVLDRMVGWTPKPLSQPSKVTPAVRTTNSGESSGSLSLNVHEPTDVRL
jgi:hypothetical protein